MAEKTEGRYVSDVGKERENLGSKFREVGRRRII